MKAENNYVATMGILDDALSFGSGSPSIHISGDTHSCKTLLASYIVRNLATVPDIGGTVMFANDEGIMTSLVDKVTGSKLHVIVHRIDHEGYIKPGSITIDPGTGSYTGSKASSLLADLEDKRPNWLVIDGNLDERILNHVYNIAALCGTKVILINGDHTSERDKDTNWATLTRKNDTVTIARPGVSIDTTIDELSNRRNKYEFDYCLGA